MPEQTSTLRQRLRDAATEAMLDSAERVMVQKGYEGATMQEIAAAAGCAAGTFYGYFKNKEELFQAIVSRHWQASARLMMEADAGTDDAVEKLRRHLDAFLGYFHQHRAFFDLFFSCMPFRHSHLLQRLGPTVRADHESFRRQEVELMVEAQRRGQVRSDIAAEVLLDYLDGSVLAMLDHFSAGRGPATREEQMTLLWGLIAGGLGAARSQP